MKTFADDILEEIEKQFKSEKEIAFNLLNQYSSENNLESSQRIIRCILFLSNGQIENLKESINIAKTDWRDIVLFAEYENSNSNESRRVRDFNKTFVENDI